MTHTQTTCLNCIALHAGKKVARLAEVGAQASVFGKSATELKQKLLKCKQTIQIATFIDDNIDMICIQEHRYTRSEDIKYHDSGKGWTLATASAWKNSVIDTAGDVGILIGPRALKPLNSIERIQPWMIVATFNGNPKATIISCYSRTNFSEETELITLCDELSSLVRNIPKHNVLIIVGKT